MRSYIASLWYQKITVNVTVAFTFVTLVKESLLVCFVFNEYISTEVTRYAVTKLISDFTCGNKMAFLATILKPVPFSI